MDKAPAGALSEFVIFLIHFRSLSLVIQGEGQGEGSSHIWCCGTAVSLTMTMERRLLILNAARGLARAARGCFFIFDCLASLGCAH